MADTDDDRRKMQRAKLAQKIATYALEAVLAGSAIYGVFWGLGELVKDRDTNEEYHYSGTIGKEQLSFTESSDGLTNYITVIKEDGSRIQYVDTGDNLTVDEIVVTANGNTTYFYATSSNPLVKEIVGKGQEQFNTYLEEILRINSAPLGLDK